MGGIPRYSAHAGLPLLSAGFRPFFLLSAVWACIGIPLWLAQYGGATQLQTVLPQSVWHAHEMTFGFAAATVAGFMLTAIPNWTGRMPLQGVPLGLLVLAWFAGRIGVLFSADIGAPAAAVLDLLFPTLDSDEDFIHLPLVPWSWPAAAQRSAKVAPNFLHQRRTVS